MSRTCPNPGQLSRPDPYCHVSRGGRTGGSPGPPAATPTSIISYDYERYVSPPQGPSVGHLRAPPLPGSAQPTGVRGSVRWFVGSSSSSTSGSALISRASGTRALAHGKVAQGPVQVAVGQHPGRLSRTAEERRRPSGARSRKRRWEMAGRDTVAGGKQAHRPRHGPGHGETSPDHPTILASSVGAGQRRSVFRVVSGSLRSRCPARGPNKAETFQTHERPSSCTVAPWPPVCPSFSCSFLS
jgi:hypothetical protein